MKDRVQFTISVKGETSGRNFEGLFEVKTKLSHKEVLKEDEIRRNVLGTNPNDAGAYAASIAGAIAYLTVRLTKSPDWFKSSANGLELEDENVLVEINNRCVAAVAAEREAYIKEAQDAQVELRKAVAEADLTK